MNFLHSFPFLVGLAPVLLFFQQARSFFLKIFHIFWKGREVNYDYSLDFYSELKKKSWSINFDDYKIRAETLYSLKHKRHLCVPYKGYQFEIFFYRYFIPIFISSKRNSYIVVHYFKYTFNFEMFYSRIINDYAKNLSNQTTDRFHVSYIKGKSLKSIGRMPDKNTELRASESSTTEIYNGSIIPYFQAMEKNINNFIGFDVKDLSYGQKEIKCDKYQLTETGQRILSHVEQWLNAEEWYAERNIVWRRGICLWGKSGCGKSSIVLEIAKKLKIPIYLFDLSSMDNEEFIREIDDLGGKPAIILFEDIDVTFEERKNLSKNNRFGGVTFDCFINKLSGVKGISNKFIFMTTNHIEKLDSALIRKGRVDEIIEILPLNLKEKTNLANVILSNRQDLVDKVLKDSDDDTTAEFESRCVELSLQTFWDEKK